MLGFNNIEFRNLQLPKVPVRVPSVPTVKQKINFCTCKKCTGIIRFHIKRIIGDISIGFSIVIILIIDLIKIERVQDYEINNND